MGHVSGGSGKGLELDVECDAGGRDFEVLLEATERNDSLENSCVGSSEFLDDITNVAPILQEHWKKPQRRTHPTRRWKVRISEVRPALGHNLFSGLNYDSDPAISLSCLGVGAKQQHHSKSTSQTKSGTNLKTSRKLVTIILDFFYPKHLTYKPPKGDTSVSNLSISFPTNPQPTNLADALLPLRHWHADQEFRLSAY
ncbi:hypothetical protein CDAR_580811 [Caerostris darwini]|uniref:Uncharacterized protein n=1 Tax=Caerostris darwini TaxID=1538125 RepID=A0AAV4RKD7_9ARAC|nr:hypothetical protein CDAR_580811 [Caerostris darwini]